MKDSQTYGTGWIPDTPDRRDKTFRRAIANSVKFNKSKSSAAKSSLGRAPRGATGRGWALYEDSLAQAVANAKSFGDTNADKKFENALKHAFPAQYQAKSGPASGIRKNLLLSAPPASSESELPSRVDLRPFMSPIENQESIGSCTAHAVIGLLEYLQIATIGKYVDASRLFLYKTTRNLLKWEGDTGAYIRETIKAARLFGSCPEEFWEYNIEEFDSDPDNFCYAFASNYQALSYYRLYDLNDIWRSLAQGYPVALGFTCFESLDSEESFETGLIPYPAWYEKTTGAHAVLAVGYIDYGAAAPGEPTDGCLIIRNSWGEEWGASGYGYLPYSYIRGFEEDEGDANANPPLSQDYWTITRVEAEGSNESGGRDSLALHNAHIAPFLI